MSRDFIAKHVATLKPSGIRKFFDIVATMDDVISLGIGEPDFTTPEPILEAGIEALRKGETHYTSNAGIYELREAIADLLEEKYRVSYDPETEVVVTVGVSEALYLALTAVINLGEEIIIPTPCFVPCQEEQVAVVPGSAFGAGGKGFVRCSYATRYEKIEKALDRMESFVNRCS